MTKQRLIGIFESFDPASAAVDRLREQAGIAEGEISVMYVDSPEGRAAIQGTHGKPGETAARGAATGGVLAAIAAGALAVPGVGVFAAGPVAAALAGAGVGAATGGVLGALIGLGIPENEAALRSEEIERGALLVAVDVTADDVERIRDVLGAPERVVITSRAE